MLIFFPCVYIIRNEQRHFLIFIIINITNALCIWSFISVSWNWINTSDSFSLTNPHAGVQCSTNGTCPLGLFAPYAYEAKLWFITLGISCKLFNNLKQTVLVLRMTVTLHQVYFTRREKIYSKEVKTFYIANKLIWYCWMWKWFVSASHFTLSNSIKPDLTEIRHFYVIHLYTRARPTRQKTLCVNFTNEHNVHEHRQI